MPESDRDILIEVRTDVKALVRDMTEPGGRVPKLEATVTEHSSQISSASGGLRTALWFIGGIGVLLLGLGTVVLAHILGGK